MHKMTSRTFTVELEQHNNNTAFCKIVKNHSLRMFSILGIAKAFFKGN